MPLRVSESREQLSTELAAYVAELCRAAKGPRFDVAVSGGSLPSILADGLVGAGPIDWKRWHIWLVDERFVPLTHPESNYLATRKALLDRVPIPESHTHAIDPRLPLEECAAEYEARLRTHFGVSRGLPRFDLVLLGVGPDGHTASLFPGHPLLDEKTKLIAPIADSPKPPPSRVTFTLPLIAAASNVAYVAAGQSKQQVLSTIHDEHGSDLPAARVGQMKTDTIWFVDEPAVRSSSRDH